MKRKDKTQLKENPHVKFNGKLIHQQEPKKLLALSCSQSDDSARRLERYLMFTEIDKREDFQNLP